MRNGNEGGTKARGTGWKPTEYYLDLEIVSYLKTKKHPLPLFWEAETEGLWSLWTGGHIGILRK